jgi:sulfur carrier protein ThiS
MEIKIFFLRILNITKIESGSRIEVKEDCTAGELLDLLEIPKDRHNAISIAVNGIPVWRSTPLKEEDTVQLLVSLGGG